MRNLTTHVQVVDVLHVGDNCSLQTCSYPQAQQKHIPKMKRYQKPT